MNGGGRCSTDTTLNNTNDVMPNLTDDSIPDDYVPDPNCTCDSCKDYAANSSVPQGMSGDDGPDHDTHIAQTQQGEQINSEGIVHFIETLLDTIVYYVCSDVNDIEANDVISSTNDSSFPADQLVMDESALAAQLLRTDTEVDTNSEVASEINSSQF